MFVEKIKPIFYVIIMILLTSQFAFASEIVQNASLFVNESEIGIDLSELKSKQLKDLNIKSSYSLTNKKVDYDRINKKYAVPSDYWYLLNKYYENNKSFNSILSYNASASIPILNSSEETIGELSVRNYEGKPFYEMSVFSTKQQDIEIIYNDELLMRKLIDYGVTRVNDIKRCYAAEYFLRLIYINTDKGELIILYGARPLGFEDGKVYKASDYISYIETSGQVENQEKYRGRNYTEDELADKLNNLDILRGTENGYEFDKAVTRAEAVTMLVRLMGKETEALASSSISGFGDVPNETHWAAPYVGFCTRNGITKGTGENTFSPDDEISLNEYITLVLRAMNYDTTIETSFDVAMQSGLLSRNDLENLKSQNVFTRYELAYVSYQSLYSKTKEKEIWGKFPWEK